MSKPSEETEGMVWVVMFDNCLYCTADSQDHAWEIVVRDNLDQLGCVGVCLAELE